MEKAARIIITDHFISKSEKERRKNVLDFIVHYLNLQQKTDSEKYGEEPG